MQSSVTHRLLSRLCDLMFARRHPVRGPNSGWVTAETHIRPWGRGRRRRGSRVKGILPAARSPSHVTPGQAAPASCPDPRAPQSGPPISGPHHRDTLGLLCNCEHWLLASGSTMTTGLLHGSQVTRLERSFLPAGHFCTEGHSRLSYSPKCPRAARLA